MSGRCTPLPDCGQRDAPADTPCHLQVCIVTGGNAGVGQATAEAMVARGARVIIACRDKARADAAAEVTKHSAFAAKPSAWAQQTCLLKFHNE